MVSTKKTIGSQGPCVGAPCTGDINEEEGIRIRTAEGRVCQNVG